MGEAVSESLASLLLRLSDDVLPLCDGRFALLGCSLGALVGFELARRARGLGLAPPEHLFVCGCGAPHSPDPTPPAHVLPDAEFLDAVCSLGGVPDEVLAHRELVELMLPILRADYKAHETYRYLAEEPLNCPITVFGGTADQTISQARLEGWSRQTRAGFALEMFDGGHFFMQEREEEFLAALADRLRGNGAR